VARAGRTPPPIAPPLPDAVAGSTIILELDPSAGEHGRSRKLIGFTVDEVVDMLAAGETLEDRTGLPGVDPTLVRAVGRRQSELFIVLNVAALLGPVLTT
jgi:chemotaxis signal transduction protein